MTRKQLVCIAFLGCACSGMPLVAADNAPRPPSVLRFQSVSINDDPRAIGGEICKVLVPAGWRVQGGPQWDFTRTANPCELSLTFTNPTGVERIATYPQSIYYWNGAGVPARGTMYLGARVEPPIEDPAQAIMTVIVPQHRRELRNAKVAGTQELPQLAKAVLAAAPPAPPGIGVSVRAAKVRFQYEVNGTPVDEDVYAALGVVVVPGRFINWELEQVCSIRGPRGRLSELENIYTVIQKSSIPNLHWFNQYTQVCDRLKQMQQYAIDQAMVRSQIITQTQKEVSATIRGAYENRQASMDRISRARSEATRGVTRYDIGGGESVELPTGYNHAWKGNNGQYIISSDPGFDPNRGSKDTWTEVFPTSPR